MAFQSCPNMAEIVIRGIVDGKELVNVLHAWKPDGYVAADVTNLAGAVDTAFSASVLPHYSQELAYADTTARGLQDSVDSSSTANAGAGNGGINVSALPANASLCLTLRTGMTGRSARGRIYTWPPPVNVQTSAQQVSASYAASLEAGFLAVRVAISTVGWFMSVLSRRNDGAERPTGVHFAVASIEARNIAIDSQRGRLSHGH